MRNVSKLCRWMLIAGVGLLISSRAAWAEIPPSVYARMQADADEVLQIEVLKVQGLDRRGPDEESHFTVTAKVVCIGRSASGLTPGQTITIGYSTVLQRSWGWAGPAPIAILKLRAYTAYLTKSGAAYTPVARSQSFIASQPDSKPC